MFKQLVITIALVSFLGAYTMAQDQTITEKTEKKECAKGCCSAHETMTMAYMDADSTHDMHDHMKSSSTEASSIIREGEIDLVAVDVNGDGMVYQDQMCWNVISDEPGKCPQCGMTLKEVSLEKAKQNLQKHDFQVKN